MGSAFYSNSYYVQFDISQNSLRCLFRKKQKKTACLLPNSVWHTEGTQTSNFFLCSPCYLPLSIVMTTCSSFTALGMMPLLLYIYTKGIYDGDLKDKVPYKGIMISLVMVLIPCSIGIFLKTKKPQYVPYIIKVRTQGPALKKHCD